MIIDHGKSYEILSEDNDGKGEKKEGIIWGKKEGERNGGRELVNSLNNHPNKILLTLK